MLRLPQPSRASMPCPPLAARSIQSRAIQEPACIGLHIVHHPLGASLRFHDHVNVIGAHVCGQQRPVLLLTTLQQCSQHDLTRAAIHVIGRLVHLPQFCRYTSRMDFEQTTSWRIVRAIDRTGCIAVQVAAATGKCDRINHGSVADAPFGEPYRSLWPRLRCVPTSGRSGGRVSELRWLRRGRRRCRRWASRKSECPPALPAAAACRRGFPG